MNYEGTFFFLKKAQILKSLVSLLSFLEDE